MQYLLKKKNMKKSIVLIAFLFLFLSNRLYANDWIQKNGYLENANPIQGSVDSVIKSLDEKYLFVFSGTNIYKWEIESGALIKTYPMKFKDGYTTKYSKDMMTYSMVNPSIKDINCKSSTQYVVNAEIYDIETDSLLYAIHYYNILQFHDMNASNINSANFNFVKKDFYVSFYYTYSYQYDLAYYGNNGAGVCYKFNLTDDTTKLIGVFSKPNEKTQNYRDYEFGYYYQNLPDNTTLMNTKKYFNVYVAYNHTSSSELNTGIVRVDSNFLIIG